MSEEQEILSLYVQSLVGKIVSRPWRGFGSYVFLELGELTTKEGFKGHTYEKGECSVSFEYDWTLESDEAVECGAHDDYVDIEIALSGLLGLTVDDARLVGQPPELQLTFSDGRRMRSCTMERGYPDWHVFIGDELFLSPRPGSLDPFRRSNKWDDDDISGAMSDHIESTANRWGEPLQTGVSSTCRDCCYLVHLNGNLNFTDYGVCTNVSSPRDGQVTNKNGYCIHHADDLPD